VGSVGRRVGRIVELEAYVGEDDGASHARFGPTDRNRIMFGPPGMAYVYLVYGMYDCLNIVTEPAGRPAALLVRAVEPLEGADAMRAARLASISRRRRGVDPVAVNRERERLAGLVDDRLASGPGLVAAAFSIDRSQTGLDLCDAASPLRLESAPAGEGSPRILVGPRVGVAYAGAAWAARPWRFAISGSAALSGPPLRG
jgi:DNA-3-methyladenine glycosylase